MRAGRAAGEWSLRRVGFTRSALSDARADIKTSTAGIWLGRAIHDADVHLAGMEIDSAVELSGGGV